MVAPTSLGVWGQMRRELADREFVPSQFFRYLTVFTRPRTLLHLFAHCAPIAEPVQISFDRASFADQLKMLAFVDVNSAEYLNGSIAANSPRISGMST